MSRLSCGALWSILCGLSLRALGATGFLIAIPEKSRVGGSYRARLRSLSIQVLVAAPLLLGSAIPAYAQLACYEWRVTDNGFDSGWRASNKSVLNAWVAAKNNGAQVTGCGATGRLYNITSVIPQGPYPYYSYDVTASWSPNGGPIVTDCTLAAKQSCPPLYFVMAPPPPLADCGPSCNGVGEPISPATGNVASTDLDIGSYGSPAPLEFRRYYNSADSASQDLGVGWHHSFSRRINIVYLSVPYRPYMSSNPAYSPLYSDEPTACTQGFAQIQGQVSTWSSATATYSGGLCVLSQGGVQIGTLPILFADQYPPDPLSTVIGYDVVRDTGQHLDFTVQSGTIVPPPGTALRLQSSGSGFSIKNQSDGLEAYDSTGNLLSVTTRAGVVQTMSYDGSGRLSAVTDSFGHSLTFSYDGQGRLSTVTRQ